MTSTSRVNRILGVVLSLAVVMNGVTIPAAAAMSDMPHAAHCDEGSNPPADDGCRRPGCDCSCFAPHFVMGVCAGAPHPEPAAADPPVFGRTLHLAGAFDAPFRPPA
jgi:hypothetical protein